MGLLDLPANAGKSNLDIEIIDNAMKNLPPLKAVVAFEACYRLRSFTRAATSLNVRQPAISHQIRLLEQDLGAKLFERQGARIAPTAAADEFYLAVSSGLSEIAHAGERLRAGAGEETMTLATYPGIAAFWLLPRLAKSTADAKPAVRVTTAERDTDIPMATVDAAVLFGRGDWPGYESILLIPEKVAPIASPAVAKVWRQRSADDLLSNGPLIHLEDPERRWFTWEDWRDHAAPEAARIASAFTVTNHGVAIQEALLGAGVALGWAGLYDDLVERGALEVLPGEALTSRRGYHLLFDRNLIGTRRLGWLLETLGVPCDSEKGWSV